VTPEKAFPQAYTPAKAGGGGDPSDSHRGDMPAHVPGNLYQTPMETHNPMEPHATIAVWEGGKLTLYDATQGVFSDRQRVATLLGLHPDDVHVVSPHQTVGVAAGQDGKLTAIRHDTIDQTSSFDEYVEGCSLQARMLYTSPNAETSHKLIKLDTGTPSFMRAPGESPGNFALESAMDELSYSIGMDPLELRLRNYADEDPEKQKPWSSKSLRECYRVGAEQFGWSKRNPKVRATRQGNNLVGWGMATACYPTRRSESSAVAKLRADGTALVEAGTQDLGTGTYTIMTQIAADAIGLPPAKVTFRLGDTEFPETPVSGGSQTAASTGSAVKLAGQALREKVIQLAIGDPHSPVHGAGAGDVTIDDGHVVLKNSPAKKEALAALMARNGKEEIEAKGDAKPGEEKDRYSMYAFGAQFAEVRVDADLGEVRVTRMVGAFAAGKILNAKTARSQLMGGMIWGIGMALMENTVFDQLRGRIVNANLAEYHVPVNRDAPTQIDVITVAEDDPHVNEIGAKGIGEIGITGATAAIVNAVYHATGKRVRDLPVTLDKLI
jgi:xanthine dehydrogenase YagR molybdenum-binding subunit